MIDEPVQPQLRVQVAPEDFPYLDMVWGYEPNVLRDLRRAHPGRCSSLRHVEAYPIRSSRATKSLQTEA